MREKLVRIARNIFECLPWVWLIFTYYPIPVGLASVLVLAGGQYVELRTEGYERRYYPMLYFTIIAVGLTVITFIYSPWYVNGAVAAVTIVLVGITGFMKHFEEEFKQVIEVRQNRHNIIHTTAKLKKHGKTFQKKKLNLKNHKNRDLILM